VPSGWSRIFHHGTDGFLLYEVPVHEGEITPAVKEGTSKPVEQFSYLPHRCEAARCVFCIWSSPDMKVCPPIGLAPEKCYWSMMNGLPSGSHDVHLVAPWNIDGDSPLTQPPIKVYEVWLQVAYEQRRLAVRGYVASVVRVEGQPNVVRIGFISMTYRLNRTGEIKSSWATPALMPRRDSVALGKVASNVRSDDITKLCG
jgi:hypothetical protein